MLAYVVSGLCAAAASVLYTGRLETGSPVHGQRILLDVIGATVIGGTSLFGGKGKVLWTVFGVFFLTLIDNSLNLLNLSHFSIMMVKGGGHSLAALMDALRNHWLAGEQLSVARPRCRAFPGAEVRSTRSVPGHLGGQPSAKQVTMSASTACPGTRPHLQELLRRPGAPRRQLQPCTRADPGVGRGERGGQVHAR